MANFVAISGAAATGKSSIAEALNYFPELTISKSVVVLDSLYKTVFYKLVDKGFFSAYEEIVKDSDYLSVFLVQVIEHHKAEIEKYKDQDCLVVFDECWLDLSIYAIINMWYSHHIKSLQEEILKEINDLNNTISRIYITKYDPSLRSNELYRSEFKNYNVKLNRPLELQYYELAKGLGGKAVALPSSDADESAFFIYEDMRNLGYL